MFLKTRLRLLESAVEALQSASGRRGPNRPKHLVTGERGERAALFWLRRRGFTVVARAWHSSRARGDLDLIAWVTEREEPTLCFIEVKTRTTRAVAPAHLAVDEDKRRTLRRLARHYLRRLPCGDVATRFDVLSVYFEPEKAVEFEHFPGAFGWEESS